MPHIVSSFDEKLAHLRSLVATMGEMSVRQLERAIAVLEAEDPELALATIAEDTKIDDLDRQVSEQAVLLLALRAPVANDLRLAVTAFKASTDLERIADHARSIAKRVLAIRQTPLKPSLQSVTQLGRRVLALVTGVVEAYKAKDAELALSVWRQDKSIDELYSGVFRELLTYMIEDTRQLEACSHILFVAKDFERIGDHATNIGEMICYEVTGHPPSGLRPKADHTTQPREDE